MIPRYYPPVGFHFAVFIKNNSKDVTKEMAIDSQFMSVSGLSVDITTEEYAEGGENRFKHKLPLKTTFPNLVLKRGLVIGSELTNWCRNAIDNFEFELKDITVILLNASHAPLMTWEVVGAMPVKWSVDEFTATESKIVIESIELSYQYFTMKNPIDYAG
jgi:phage tail-like protein